MPITVRTASGTIGAILMRGIAPVRSPPLHRSTNFFSTGASTAGPTIAPPRVLALFGRTGMHRLVGATLLNSVLRRNTCHLLKSAHACGPRISMVEPYGTLIGTIQPDLLKLGFIKVHENEHTMTFADGTSKVDFTVTDRHYHPVLTVYFINRNGEHFNLDSLRDKLNSSQTKKQDVAAFRAMNEKYGLWDCTTPQATREQGYRAGVLLNLKQTVTFLEEHKQILAEFGRDNEWD